MDVTVGSASITPVETANQGVASDKTKDNVAREEQKEVVSKDGNDAIRSMGLALLSPAIKRVSKQEETSKSEVAPEEAKTEPVKTEPEKKVTEVKTEIDEVKPSEQEATLVAKTETKAAEPKAKSDIEAFKEELTAKYLANDPKQKAKPAIEALFSGSEEEVLQRIELYKQVRAKDKNISPIDFVKAQEDLADLKDRELDELAGDTDAEKLEKLSKSRHLLGGAYSSDFAVEMVDLDRTFDTYQQDLGMNEGAKAASRDVRISSHSVASKFGIQDDKDVKGLANLAAQAYMPKEKLKPERLGGYEVLDSRPGKNGFYSTAFKDKDGNIVIAYRGSDDVSDIKSDLEMINGTKLPEQFYDAEQFYEDIKAANPKAKIILTGHSLGGALSQLVAAHNEDAFAVTFNAPGTKDIIDHESGLSDSGNIYNVIVDGDKISGTLEQPGVTQLIDAKTDRFGDKLHPHAIGNCM